MHKMAAKKRLVGMAASLRKSSYSDAVLSSLRKSFAAAEIHSCDLDLPLYNQDEDGPAARDDVRALREAIRASEGVVIVTPEYNHGMPGILKNALDWISRPHGQSVLIDKPVLVISASPAFTGGVRAQAQVNETLLAIGARIVPGPQVIIGSVHDKIADNLLVDEPSLRFALAALDRLIAMLGNDRTSQSLSV